MIRELPLPLPLAGEGGRAQRGRVRVASCYLAVLAVLAPGCGKRGDPLPPLRPVPAAAEPLVIRQVGTTLELEWQAPSRNHDGTTEKLDLRDVSIFRRVLDLDALVEEQTQPVEPLEEELDPLEAGPDAEGETAPPPEEPGEEPETETATEPQIAEELPDGEVPQGPETPTEPTGPTGDEEAILEDLPPAIPPRPALQIPPFFTEAEVIATLPSTELSATLSYEEGIEADWLGKRVEYALIYTNRKKRASPPSSVVQIEPIEELEVPGAPVASVGDGRVELRWETDTPSEEAFFDVYRRDGDAESYPKKAVNPIPVGSPELVDEAIVFGRPICYGVRRVVPPPTPPVEALPVEAPPVEEPSVEEPPVEEPEQAEAEVPPALQPMPSELVPVVPPIANPVHIESLLSEETCLTPEDTFPPETPTDVVGVSIDSGIFLTWDVVEAEDLAGYRVYRSSAPSGPFELLNAAIVVEASYADETAEEGRTYYYAITTVDSTEAVNESGRSELAEARRLSP